MNYTLFIIPALEIPSGEIHHQVVNYMDTISFTCETSGYPSSEIIIAWRMPAPNDRINIDTMTNGNQTISVLTIHSIQLSDTGIYTCTASLGQLTGNISYNLTVGMFTVISLFMGIITLCTKQCTNQAFNIICVCLFTFVMQSQLNMYHTCFYVCTHILELKRCCWIYIHMYLQLHVSNSIAYRFMILQQCLIIMILMLHIMPFSAYICLRAIVFQGLKLCSHSHTDIIATNDKIFDLACVM